MRLRCSVWNALGTKGPLAYGHVDRLRQRELDSEGGRERASFERPLTPRFLVRAGVDLRLSELITRNWNRLTRVPTCDVTPDVVSENCNCGHRHVAAVFVTRHIGGRGRILVVALTRDSHVRVTPCSA